MPLIFTPDKSSFSQVCQQLASMNLEEAVGALEMVRNRPGMQRLPWAQGLAAAVESSTPLGEMLRAGQVYELGTQGIAVAAQFSQIGLFNPITASVALLVFDAWAVTASAALNKVFLYQLTTSAGFGNTSTGFSANANAAPGKAVVAFGTNAAIPIGGGLQIDIRAAPLNQTLSFGNPSGEPFFDLPPGAGLVLADATANETLIGGFRWAELPLDNQGGPI